MLDGAALSATGSHRTSIVLSRSEIVELRGLAIAGASLSILAGLPMLYWFWRLRRRTFRHQLVMLLIISDFFKALCEFIYPASTITSGKVVNDVYCTVLGFFTTVFIDASDFAILLIATHTALSIFFPSRGTGPDEAEKTGLYRWRYAMYACWAIYPLTLSSLAFLNKQTAYTDSVSWCYLPIRPFYWRVALSWGPRYLILFYILIVYVSIFFYVRIKFKSVHGLFLLASIDDESSQNSPDGTMSLPPHESRLGPVAELDVHDLLTPGLSDVDSKSYMDQIYTSTSVYAVRNTSFPAVAESASPEKANKTAPRTRSMLISEHHDTSSPSFERAEQQEAEQYSPSNGVIAAGSDEGISRTFSDPLKAERLRIIKQLRLLFIFPVVYFLMWLIPFGYHTTQYNDKALTNPILGLARVSAFIIPLHGLVDVIVYAGNEKPWRSLRFGTGSRANDHRRLSGPSTQSRWRDTFRISASVDPTDIVARRHEEEVLAAKDRKAERAEKIEKMRLSNTAKDWYDLEIARVDADDAESPPSL